MGDQSAVNGAKALNSRAAELFGDVGAPDHDRRLSDKILAAFNHAYSVGETAIAEQLRVLLLDPAVSCPDHRSRRLASSRLRFVAWSLPTIPRESEDRDGPRGSGISYPNTGAIRSR